MVSLFCGNVCRHAKIYVFMYTKAALTRALHVQNIKIIKVQFTSCHKTGDDIV